MNTSQSSHYKGLVQNFVKQLGWAALMGMLIAVILAGGFAYLTFDVLSNATVGLDYNIQSWVRSFDTDVDDTILTIFTMIGGLEGIGVIGGLLTLYFVLTKKYRRAILTFLVVGGGMALNTVFKEIFQRARPNLASIGGAVERPGSYSFPSGHATMSACFYGFLLYLGVSVYLKTPILKIIWAITMLVIILLVGVSRIYFGVHYPSDIVGGYILGAFWLISILIADYAYTSRREQRQIKVAANNATNL